MSHVTSTQLWAGAEAPGYYESDPVPEGLRWLVRDVRLEARGDLSFLGAGFSDDDFGYVSIFATSHPAPNDTVGLTDSFVVVNAGQVLWVQGEGDDFGFVISGHLLHLP